MDGILTLLTTLDGSTTFYNQAIHQTYHSVNGAFQESHHVFLENGLQNYLALNQLKEINIIEVGFGSGLNFLVTADYCATQGIKLNYTGLEPFPINLELFMESHYNKWLNNQKVWNNLLLGYEEAFARPEGIQIFPNIILKLSQTPLMDFKADSLYDLVYYDAFAPITQAEMWSKESIGHITEMLVPCGHFITYSITGNLKRNLKSLDFGIEKPKGAAGKREMLRAFKCHPLKQ